jgi:catecholate siderophore receptor
MKIRPKKNSKKNAHPNKRKSTRRGAKYWASLFALSSLMASAPYTSKAMTITHVRAMRGGLEVVYAQGQGQTGQTAQAAQRFDIPSGALQTVLDVFQKQTGWQVVVPIDAIRSIGSPGVSGNFTPEQALKQVLTGTGVGYKITAKDTVTLEISGVVASVDVLGKEIISSPKYTEPLRNVPQTISIIPKAVIEEQGATTLRDVLRNVPGLTVVAGEGGTPAGDNLTLRGFSARNDIFVDGARDLGPQSRDPFNLEQVEVVKGPSSSFNGRGSTGGTINLVSKSPGLQPSFGGSLNFGTDRTKRVTTDVNLPVKRLGLGERTAFRLNTMWHDSGVAGRDVVKNERWGLAPSLGFGVGTPTRLTLSYVKTKQDNISDYGIPWVPATNTALIAYRDKPAPVPRNTFYGLKNRDGEKLNSDLATVKFERDFDDNLTFRNQFRYGRSTRDSIATPPRFANTTTTAINRELRAWKTEDEIWDNQADMRARFSTGKITHALVTGAAITRESNIRVTRTGPNSPTTLLNPNTNDIYPGVITTSPIVGDLTADSQALYVLDTAKVSEKFDLNGSLRWDRFDADGVSTAGAAVKRVDTMVSWRAGAVYKPKPQGSIYGAYGTSLNPSLEGLSYNTANTAIEPEKTYTAEFGTKWDLVRERLSVSGAIFRVDKTNARTPGVLPDDPPQVLQGTQRVDGIELGASGTISRNWTVLAGYSLLDTKVVKSNTAVEVGKRLQNTPRNSFNIWSTYRFFGKLTVGGGPRFVGKRFGNNTNTRFVESYWTVEGMASYPLTSHIDLRLNLYNLNDAYYFDRLGGGHVVPGPARAANLSLGFRF